MDRENQLNPPQVMVVDDAGIIRMTIRRLLEREGYRVKVAENAQQALSMMMEKTPDAMLVDLKMPAMTGLDLVRVIKNNWPGIEIVIITAYADSDMVRQTREHGAMEVLFKPVTDLTRLKKTVARAAISTRLWKNTPVREEALLRPALLMRGIVKPGDFERALSTAAEEGKSAGDCLLRQGSISKHDMKKAVEEFLKEDDDQNPELQIARTM